MEPTQTSKPRPKPLIAVLAVAIPMVAIVIAAVVTSARSDDRSATPTTISQAGDPAASGSSSSGGAKGGGTKGTTTTSKGKADGKGKGATTTTAAADPETPTDPADTGPEGERTSVTYPQPTVPASGCSRPSGTAVITLGSGPSPACLHLSADQAVVVKNRTGKEISFVAISVNEVIAAGSEMRIGTASSAFGDGRSTFWSPGNPQLSGIVIVG